MKPTDNHEETFSPPAAQSKSRKGDLAEYYATTWLWDNGYEVFKNSGCSGSVDMVAMDSEGEILLIDVKTAGLNPSLSNPDAVNSRSVRTKQQVKLGVRILLFNPLNRKLRFVDHERFTNTTEGEQLEIF